MLPRTKIVPHIRMWKVVLKKRKEKKSKVVDWHARYSRENYRGIRTPPFIPPWRVHFPSNKQPKELFPTMKIFLFPSGWRFGSLKRSRWRDPKEARSFFSAFERERERERKVGGNDLLSSKRYNGFFNRKKLRGGGVCVENMFNSIVGVQGW